MGPCGCKDKCWHDENPLEPRQRECRREQKLQRNTEIGHQGQKEWIVNSIMKKLNDAVINYRLLYCDAGAGAHEGEYCARILTIYFTREEIDLIASWQ